MKYFISLLLFSLTLNSQIDLDRGLIANWSFDDETAKDFSGNGNDGIIRSTHEFVEGKFGRGLQLISQGNNGGWVDIPSFDFEKMDCFAISLWINYTSVNFEGGFLIHFGDHQYGCLGINYHTLRPVINQNFYLQYSVGSVHYPFGTDNFDELIKPIEYRYEQSKLYNNWNHMLMNYKDGVIYAYLNGQLIDSLEQDVRVRNNNAAIGRHWWKDGGSSSSRLNAIFDEVRIYERCLSDEEIEELFDPADVRPSPCNIDDKSSSQIFEEIDYTKVNDAVSFDTIVRLTKQEEFQKAAIWSNTKHNLKADFSVKASISISDGINAVDEGSNPGADGFAIVFQNYSLDAIGKSGGGIGYEGIPNSVAIELDLYNNFLNINDPNGYHFAVMSNGAEPNSAVHGAENDIYTKPLNLDLIGDDRKYQILINYFAESKELILLFGEEGKKLYPIFTLSDFDFSDYLDLDNGAYSFIGITSATGTSKQRHEVHLFNICSSEPLDIEPFKNENFSIIENPTGNELRIFYGDLHIKKIKIIDYFGNEILTFDHLIRGEKSLNISELSNGAYFLVIETSENAYLDKFIKR